MNQNEQLRLDSIKERESRWHFKTMTTPDLGHAIAIGFMEGLKLRDEQTLAQVNEKPKTEHIEADASNKPGNVGMMREALRELTDAICNGRYEDPAHDRIYRAILEAKQALTAEPTTLVRLTEEEQVKIVTFFLNCGLGNWQKLWQCSNAIMDVIERKNKGAE